MTETSFKLQQKRNMCSDLIRWNATMSYVSKAYATIKRNILDNRYPPGYQALERQLADELQMSRTPIREALIRLQEEGLVEVLPRHGMRVIPLSPEDMQDIYEVLSGLEVTAIELLAHRRPDNQQLAEMEIILEDMDKALERNDLDAWAHADASFHQALIALCGNNKLTGLVATLTDRVHRARLFTLRLRPKPIESNQEHRQVLAALREGDFAAAARRHRRHRRQAANMITELIGTYRIQHL
jgi:DNA-binding GntR family transcriptional regulator